VKEKEEIRDEGLNILLRGAAKGRRSGEQANSRTGEQEKNQVPANDMRGSSRCSEDLRFATKKSLKKDNIVIKL
jgi:hypothetical protein